jgi:hypothetical protein
MTQNRLLVLRCTAVDRGIADGESSVPSPGSVWNPGGSNLNTPVASGPVKPRPEARSASNSVVAVEGIIMFGSTRQEMSNWPNSKET